MSSRPVPTVTRRVQRRPRLIVAGAWATGMPVVVIVSTIRSSPCTSRALARTAAQYPEVLRRSPDGVYGYQRSHASYQASGDGHFRDRPTPLDLPGRRRVTHRPT